MKLLAVRLAVLVGAMSILLLGSLTDIAGSAQAQSAPQSPPPRPLSAAEVRGVMETLRPCWNLEVAQEGQAPLPPVEVRIFLDSSGLVIGVELLDKDYPKKSPQHGVAAQSALRSAVNPRCRQMPASLGDIGQMIVVFDPKDPL